MNLYHRISILFFLGVGFLTYSCANSIDPIDEETGIYGIYGVLDLKKDINKIRVKDLNVPFTEKATRNIDAEVTLENLETGAVTLLDSIALMNFEGVFLHNFIYEKEIIPDTEYRLTAKRSDGVSVSLLSKTPTRPQPTATPQNQDCSTPITFELGPTNGGTVELSLGFSVKPDTIIFLAPAEVLKPNYPSIKTVAFTFTPEEEVQFLPPGLGFYSCRDLARDFVFIRYTHYGPDFYEKITNAPFDILSSTKRFGSLYTDTLGIPLDTSEN